MAIVSASMKQAGLPMGPLGKALFCSSAGSGKVTEEERRGPPCRFLPPFANEMERRCPAEEQRLERTGEFVHIRSLGTEELVKDRQFLLACLPREGQEASVVEKPEMLVDLICGKSQIRFWKGSLSRLIGTNDGFRNAKMHGEVLEPDTFVASLARSPYEVAVDRFWTMLEGAHMQHGQAHPFLVGIGNAFRLPVSNALEKIGPIGNRMHPEGSSVMVVKSGKRETRLVNDGVVMLLDDVPA